MTTLRRELIQKFVNVIQEQCIFVREDGDKPDWHNEQTTEFAELLADAALELRGFRDKEPMFDMSKAGIEWNILAGNEIKQGDIDLYVLEKETIQAFESAFSIKGNWNWYPAKPQEERVWKKFRERLMGLYAADKECFTKYVTWIAQPFSRGTMTGLQIKKNPQDFPDAWASFCMSTKYAAPRKPVSDDQRTDLDAGGIPMSY